MTQEFTDSNFNPRSLVDRAPHARTHAPTHARYLTVPSTLDPVLPFPYRYRWRYRYRYRYRYPTLPFSSVDEGCCFWTLLRYLVRQSVLLALLPTPLAA